jgi:hypothetical protein
VAAQSRCGSRSGVDKDIEWNHRFFMGNRVMGVADSDRRLSSCKALERSRCSIADSERRLFSRKIPERSRSGGLLGTST